MDVHFRKRHQEDDAFIYATWLRGQRNEGLNQYIGNKAYFANQADKVKPLIERAQTVVACNPESHEHVYGFLVYDILEGIVILHYIHVKTPFRKLGLGLKMIKHINHNFVKEETVISHINGLVGHRIQKYKLVFNPYVLELLQELRGKTNEHRNFAGKVSRIFGST